jgi:hypothetical protein
MPSQFRPTRTERKPRYEELRASQSNVSQRGGYPASGYQRYAAAPSMGAYAPGYWRRW